MPTLPTSSTFDDFGGTIQDYSTPENLSTQWSAAESNPMRASVAAMTPTCFRVIVTFYIDGYATPQITDVQANWDVANSSAPSISYTGVGRYNLLCPSLVLDLQGEPQNLNLLGGVANVDVANVNGWFASIQRVSGVSFNIFVWSSVDGALEDLPNDSPVEIFIR